ncbi:lysylphosphatidylglycerol synthase domain-containing protein [Azomonas macrocytogenes]|uniref:Uncharacterized protein n=1 Tax=Azomonas macrocytogenes TaxID=69962 RepID=A0A839SYZ4_AZOMA|nr:lysylphosphatidylglycerol synthase domain-containing protein [Azomonas macrocytogenes]MBB3102362.1 hypothetical protein [Azomonas macrocytogenes]
MRHPSSRSGRWQRAWPMTRKILSYAFLILIAGLLVGLARKLNWQEIMATLGTYQARTLWMAGTAALGSYLVYCFFDVLGKHYVRHALPVRQVLPITFVCYAFNLNLSAWVGGIALRYRLYGRLGIRPALIARIFTLSLMTNWLGYMCLAGISFTSGWIRPPANWEIGNTVLQLLGIGLVLVGFAHLAFCHFSKRRAWTIHGHEIRLPSLRMAALQLVLGAANWSLMALVIYYMLLQKIPYLEVLGILLISSIAGVITHIPAGLGVIEAVFVTLLAGQMSRSGVIAGLIGYRVIYFLIPLLLATLVYVVLEAQARKLRKEKASKPKDMKFESG